jgi:hypothetical protein
MSHAVHEDLMLNGIVAGKRRRVEWLKAGAIAGEP